MNLEMGPEEKAAFNAWQAELESIGHNLAKYADDAVAKAAWITAWRAAERRGYERAKEEACKAVCKLCAEGKLEAGKCRGHWHHYWDSDEGGIAGDCKAGTIRSALTAKEPDGEKPKSD